MKELIKLARTTYPENATNEYIEKSEEYKKAIQALSQSEGETTIDTIKKRIIYFKEIHHRYEAQRLEEALRCINELLPPQTK